MSARDVVLAWMTGQAEAGWDEDDPEYQKACKTLDAYRDQILREATAKIRANTVIPSDVETAHDYAEFLADLIDPDREQR